MNRDGGLIPPKVPHFDVRTPEYVVFPDVQRQPWECVRGMDESFGHNAYSRPEDFITHDDLLWLLTDITAKGGNLLLNVGPRGVDAQIPPEQLQRLQWLGEWVNPNREALLGTRPWVEAGELVDESPVRFTSAGDSVFAFLREPPSEVTFAGLRATPTTTVATLGARPLDWGTTDQGIRVTLDMPRRQHEPVVVALRHVEASARRGVSP